MKSHPILPDMLLDCQIMLRFALKEGLGLTEELFVDIAQLDKLLRLHGLPSISSLPILDSSDSQVQLASPEELALKVHSELSKLVAPATAFTLRISEPPEGKHGFLSGMPPLIKAASWVAVVCALGFVITALPAASEKLPATGSQVAKTAEVHSKRDKADNNAATPATEQKK